MNVAGGRAESCSGADIVNQGGEWITPPISYVDPRRRFCAFCGRPIARRFWRVSVGGAEAIFCDPAHAHLDATYPSSTPLLLENPEGS
jgi:hypothetical protein